MARPRIANPDTRQRILAAATSEFGAHGFAATTVDRIARRAHVNKAMIYYHFADKRALYACIIRDVFAPIANACVRDGGTGAAARRLARIIETLVQSVDQSTHFLPLFLREIADGGEHLGPEARAPRLNLFAIVSGVVIDGAKRFAFQPVHPALAHFTIIGPLIMFRASAPVRARVRSVRHVDIPDADSETLVRHLQMVAQRMLAVDQRADSRGQR
jgi:AcrR family transcriptional regulator